ncbi:ClC family H(+)/Cl(-) exchange transporter [Kineococcus rhizosphaerae]|uniref:CIC family chloride channel protein n=1 Tax=Kineococcus rhizosphaerae TaxID=559628 RepID=A0A2T0QWY0_9ACTN|nr:ClC family H(+)/Cl(-) exchange transporter [Kineococcus rhizosphaerae]PRY10066.1 CIC family chloride channel protein [Kineococcus rhizosphaerae]
MHPDRTLRWLRSTFTGWQRPTSHPVDDTGEGAESLVGFALAAACVGALTGLTAATFRLLLTDASDVRERLATRAHDLGVPGAVLVVAGCAAATALAAALVRRVEPHAEGSGIPHVQAVVRGRTEPGRFRVLPVKYVGGLLSIGSGLALGREGPSVQMGSTVAVIVASATRRSRQDLRLLVAAGAAAGLATAFNAPIAGGVFVLEELLKSFHPRATIATLVSSAAGFAVAFPLVHGDPEFAVPPLDDPRLVGAGWVLAVGVLTGVLGVLYNRAVMTGLRLADSSRWPAEARAALVGAAVGGLVWSAPQVVGGGDGLTQDALLGRGSLAAVGCLLLVRFVLGVVSYAAGTPGGLFAPMLVLGSESGLLVGIVGTHLAPGSTPPPAALAVVGMAAFFTSTVHTPVTGLVLATELSGSTNQLFPMLGACAVAMLVAVGLRSRPIYELLTDRAARPSPEAGGRRAQERRQDV